MAMRFSRRTASGMMLSFPFTLIARSSSVAAQSTNTQHAAIGANREAFDAHFGEGREEDWFTVYDFSDEGKASYWVAWDANDHAHQIANDYSAIANGGLPFDPGLLGQSQFLPDDASINLAGDMTNLQVGESGFYIAQHQSLDVRANTDRSGNILVVDQRPIPGDGPNNPNFTRTSIAMEAFEVNPIVSTGALPTLESSWQEWQSVFGESWGTQRGTMPMYPPVPGRWMFDGDRVDVLLDTPIPAVEAARWVSDFLPTDLGPMSTTYWLPAPADTEGLRVCIWPQNNSQHRVALQVVQYGEETGTTSRFIIATVAPAMV